MNKTHPIRRDLPSMTALRAFEAAARLGSFTLAAEHLFLTQSAISRHVRNLELRLGVTLFRRNGRHLTLTAEGREYMAAAGDAFDRIAEATAILRHRRPGDILTVSMLPSVATKWFASRLADFINTHPTIDLRISASPHLADLEADGIDVAIRYGRGDWSGVEAEELTHEEITPVCSPRLLAGEARDRIETRTKTQPLGSRSSKKASDFAFVHEQAIPPQPLAWPQQSETPLDLTQFMLLHGELHEDWHMWLKAAGYGHIASTHGPRFSDASSLIQAAIDGLGIALGRTLLVADDLVAGRLVAPFAFRLRTEFSYWLVVPKRHQHPNVTAFHDWLRRQLAATRGLPHMT